MPKKNVVTFVTYIYNYEFEVYVAENEKEWSKKKLVEALNEDFKREIKKGRIGGYEILGDCDWSVDAMELINKVLEVKFKKGEFRRRTYIDAIFDGEVEVTCTIVSRI